MELRAFVVGPFQTNGFLVACPATREAVLVDPGGDAEALAGAIRKAGVTLRALWATHAHIDHVGAAATLQEAFGVPFLLHRDDLFWIERLESQAAYFGLPAPRRPKPDGFIADGEHLKVGRIALTALHVPGHAPGHLAFHAPAEKALLCGDVLFAGGVGRTDFPGCSSRALLDSIRRKLFPLGDDVVCHPGHGPATTIGEERRTNPFVGEAAE